MGKFVNTAKLYLIVNLLVRLHSLYAIPGTISPLDPRLHVGSDVNITCTLNTTLTSYTASDIIWKTTFSGPAVDPSLIDVISESAAVFQIKNVTIKGDHGDEYYCHLPGEDFFSWIGTSLHIGLSPTKPTLECFSTNIVDYWCEWSKVEGTNFVDEYTFQYQYPLQVGFEWRLCPDYPSEYRCNVPMDDGNGNLQNPGIQHDVQIIVENPLGNATTQITFWPEMDAIPLPPMITSVVSGQTSLTVTFILQEDLIFYYLLRYHIRYKRSDSASWTEHTDLENKDPEVTIFGLDYYTQYDLQARAQFKHNAWSDWGETYQARTLEGAPEGSVNFTVDEMHNKFTRNIWLQWMKYPEDALNGHLNGYRVTLWQTDSITMIEEFQADVNAISYIINDITLFEELYVSVVAYSSVGQTRPDKKQILDKTDEPGMPTNIDGDVVSSSEVDVSWGVPNEPGSLILTYQLDWLINGRILKSEMIDSNAKEEATISFSVSGLEPYTVYQFQVRAGNNMGYGKYSNIIERQTFEAEPNNISTFSVNAVEMNSTILSIMWTAPEKPNGIITYYNIYYQKFSEDVFKISLPSEYGTTYLLQDLEAYTLYNVWMTANNSAGESYISYIISKKTSQGTPSVPRNVTVSDVTSFQFSVDWTEPVQVNGVLKHYKVQYRRFNDTEYFEKEVTNTQITIMDLLGYTDYEVSVSACSEAHPDYACSLQAPPTEAIKTLIGVPGPVQDLTVNFKSSQTIELQWKAPEFPNGPIDHYLVDHHYPNMEKETFQVSQASLLVNVTCSVEEILEYKFVVRAANKVGNTLLTGADVSKNYEYECHPDLTIILYILIPSVIILIFVLLGFICKTKYHHKYFTPWPEPKIIQVIIDPELSPRPIEKEMFDDLKKRPNSHTSNGSTTSSDQGFHEMSLSLSPVELNTSEQKVHYDNKTFRSDSLSDDLEDDTFYPEEETVTSEDTVQENDEKGCHDNPGFIENTGQEYFHMTYQYNLAENSIQYQHIKRKGSQETLTVNEIENTPTGTSCDSAPDIEPDPYIKLVPSSSSNNSTNQPISDGENCTYIQSVVLNEKDKFDDTTTPEVDDHNGEFPEAQRSNRLLSGDYVTSSNFRVIHPISDSSNEDFSGTGSVIDDYSQIEMGNLSEFLENITGNA